MINWIEKPGLKSALMNEFGVEFLHVDGQIVADIEDEKLPYINDFISQYDGVTYARCEALKIIKSAVAEKRQQFITQNKDGEYLEKRAAILKFRATGVVDGFASERCVLTGETPEDVIAEWEAISSVVLLPVQRLAAIEDYARMTLNSRTDAENFSTFLDECLEMVEVV